MKNFDKMRGLVPLAIVALMTAVAAAPNTAMAQWTHTSTVHNTNNPINTQTLAPALEGIAGWFTITDGFGEDRTFGLTIYDQWTAYTAAHITGFTYQRSTLHNVGTSLNSNNPSSGQVVGIAGYDFDPQYDGIANHDLMRIRFSSPLDLSQFTNRPNGPLLIATSINEGDIFYMAGRALWGAPDIGIQPSDGKLRVSSTVNTFTAPTYGIFDTHWAGKYSLSNPDPLDSIAMNFMSGGTVGVFRHNNVTGKDDFYFLGPISGGTYPTPANEGVTYVAKFDLTFVLPAPLALIINASTNKLPFRFTLTGPAGSNAVISASTNLQTWTPLYTNTLGSGAFSFTDTQATNYPRRFYRAKLQ